MRSRLLAVGAVLGAVVLAVGCGSEHVPDNDIDAPGSSGSTSSSGGSSSSGDAGFVLPDDLETCSTTKESTPRVDGFSAQQIIVPSPYGKIIRDGALLVEPRVTFGDRRYETTNLYTSMADSAAPYDVGAPPDWAESPLFDLVGKRDVVTTYLESVRVLPDEEMHFAVEYDQSAYRVSGSDPTAPATGNEPDDEYVFGVGGHSLYRMDLILGFSRDGACHIRNIRKVLGRDFAAPARLELVALAGDPERAAAIQAYLDHAKVQNIFTGMFVAQHEITLGGGPLEITSVAPECQAESFAKCAEALPNTLRRRDAYLAARREPTAAMLAGEEAMSDGWTPLLFLSDALRP